MACCRTLWAYIVILLFETVINSTWFLFHHTGLWDRRVCQVIWPKRQGWMITDWTCSGLLWKLPAFLVSCQIDQNRIPKWGNVLPLEPENVYKATCLCLRRFNEQSFALNFRSDVLANPRLLDASLMWWPPETAIGFMFYTLSHAS